MREKTAWFSELSFLVWLKTVLEKEPKTLPDTHAVSYPPQPLQLQSIFESERLPRVPVIPTSCPVGSPTRQEDGRDQVATLAVQRAWLGGGLPLEKTRDRQEPIFGPGVDEAECDVQL